MIVPPVEYRHPNAVDWGQFALALGIVLVAITIAYSTLASRISVLENNMHLILPRVLPTAIAKP